MSPTLTGAMKVMASTATVTTRPPAFDGGDGAGDVHLAHHPAAEDVAGRVGVGGHGQGADGEGAVRLGFVSFCHCQSATRPVSSSQCRRHKRDIFVISSMAT